MYSKIRDLLWNNEFWLPENVRWEELETVDTLNIYDLFYCIPVACCIFLLRYAIKEYVSTPFGKYLGLKERVAKSLENNPALEKEFQFYGHNLLKDNEKLRGFVKKGFGDERQIQRWLRKRNSQENQSTLTKFSESHWKLLWYTSASVYGFYILWDKPWLWDVQKCWTAFPLQIVPRTIKWYYISGSAFSLTLMLVQFLQFNAPRKKDHWQLVVHHFATICLLMLSYISNLTRVGSLILFIHDLGDVFLQLTKASMYAGNKSRNFCFLSFVVIWIFTRLIYFPFIIYNILIKPKPFEMFPIFWICSGMLIVLQCLHIIWTVYIFRILRNAVTKGHEIRDTRSETESSD